jgi:putative transposase
MGAHIRYDCVMNTEERDIWYWHHNISECFYHIQLTVKYRRSVLEPPIQHTMKTVCEGLNERYHIHISHLGFDQNHVHLLTRFLPSYSGGQVIKVIKSLTGKAVFRDHPEVKKYLWGGAFWTDGYYIATISGHGNRRVIENYIKNQGRPNDLKQLTIFEL